MPQPVAVAPSPVVPAPAVLGKPAAPPPVGTTSTPAKPAVDPAAPVVPSVVEDPIVWEGKVDGEMVKVKKSEADRLLSKGKFADRATQEAREAIKRAKQISADAEAEKAARLERAKNDTDAYLKELGIDPDEYARRKLERKVEEGKMTPEQRRNAELEADNKRLKDAQEKAAQDRKAEQTQQLTTQLQRGIENQLSAAAKRVGMSQGDESFYAIYQSFQEMFDLGLLPLDTGGLLPQHADRIVEDAQARLDGAQKSLRENALKLKGPDLLAFVGKEAVDAIVNARLEEIRASRGITRQAPAAPAAPAAPTGRPSTYLTPTQADAEFKKALNGQAR